MFKELMNTYTVIQVCFAQFNKFLNLAQKALLT